MGAEAVAAVLANVDTAPIGEPLRATLRLLKKVTRDVVTADDMRAVLAAGVTRAQIEDALDVAYCFNVITRLADTFAFQLQNPAELLGSAKHLLKRGYR
jgi:hypothetical protein